MSRCLKCIKPLKLTTDNFADIKIKSFSWLFVWQIIRRKQNNNKTEHQIGCYIAK